MKRNADGSFVYRKWSRVDSWAAKAGKRPEVIGEQSPAEFWTGSDRADAWAADKYAEECAALAAKFEQRAHACRADADRAQTRFDSWVADAPLVPVK